MQSLRRGGGIIWKNLFGVGRGEKNPKVLGGKNKVRQLRDLGENINQNFKRRESDDLGGWGFSLEDLKTSPGGGKWKKENRGEGGYSGSGSLSARRDENFIAEIQGESRSSKGCGNAGATGGGSGFEGKPVQAGMCPHGEGPKSRERRKSKGNREEGGAKLIRRRKAPKLRIQAVKKRLRGRRGKKKRVKRETSGVQQEDSGPHEGPFPKVSEFQKNNLTRDTRAFV